MLYIEAGVVVARITYEKPAFLSLECSVSKKKEVKIFEVRYNLPKKSQDAAGSLHAVVPAAAALRLLFRNHFDILMYIL